MGKIKNITGETFGVLRVVSFAGVTPDAKRLALWNCACACGMEVIVAGAALRSGKRKSCGCLLRRHIHAQTLQQTRHGCCARTAVTGAWRSWKSMHDRCKANHKSHKSYYDKGITVCDRWQVFENFYADMGDRPEGTTLDRIDNSKGYTPENCRWADAYTQANNRSSRRLYQAFGKALTLLEWAKDPICIVSFAALHRRVHLYGVHIDEALTLPKGSKLK